MVWLTLGVVGSLSSTGSCSCSSSSVDSVLGSLLCRFGCCGIIVICECGVVLLCDGGCGRGA